jgi:hypothetical protein
MKEQKEGWVEDFLIPKVGEVLKRIEERSLESNEKQKITLSLGQ